jgi:hypothetical protein
MPWMAFFSTFFRYLVSLEKVEKSTNFPVIKPEVDIVFKKLSSIA